MRRLHLESRLTVSLPRWLVAETRRAAKTPMRSIEQRMAWVIGLAAKNATGRGGGPFAAAIFDAESHRLVSAGVNLVEPAANSVLHAEIVAIMLAQKSARTWDLASVGRMELVTSCEPCAMCMGAIPWSGLRRVVCGARDADARRIGFDEGTKPANWTTAYRRRGIEVVRDLLRREAATSLREYAQMGGTVY